MASDPLVLSWYMSRFIRLTAPTKDNIDDISIFQLIDVSSYVASRQQLSLWSTSFEAVKSQCSRDRAFGR